MTLRMDRVGMFVAAAAMALGGLPARAELPVLTRTSQVQKLTVGEADKPYRVDLTGTVTFISRVGDMFLQDESGGVFVFPFKSHADTVLQPGDRVRLRGRTTAADYSPSITDAEIHFLSKGPMPEPLRIPMDPLISGREDARWIEVGGVAHSGQIKGGLLFLNMIAPGGLTFLTISEKYPEDWTKTLVDARVTVRGVLAAIFNQRRQSVAFRVFVPDLRHVQVDSAAPADPFALPLASTLSIGQFHPTADQDRRIHVRGTALAVESHSRVFLADREGSLQIEGDSSCAVTPGHIVEAAGFPASIDRRPGLEDAICRDAGPGAEPAPLTATAVDVIPAPVHSDPTGYGISVGTKYDLKRITISGTLLQSSQGPEGPTWSLGDNGETFVARLPKDLGAWAAEPGARFRLTGVCVLTFDGYHRAQNFRVLVVDPGDVALVARAPWQNLKLAVWSVCGLALVCLAALTWGSALRRQVQRQTRELQEANGTLQRLTSLDPLTGTGNRRHFDAVLRHELQRSLRSRSPLSLLMIDIDLFKSINDRQGHQAGDACLKEIAQALTLVVRRAGDVVCRYGGEEFGVVLPSTGMEQALGLAEQIRSAVLDLAIKHPASPWGVVSVSVGVATTGRGESAHESDLVASADRALYEAKRGGRNRVCGAEAAANRDYDATPVSAGVPAAESA